MKKTLITLLVMLTAICFTGCAQHMSQKERAELADIIGESTDEFQRSFNNRPQPQQQPPPYMDQHGNVYRPMY